MKDDQPPVEHHPVTAKEEPPVVVTEIGVLVSDGVLRSRVDDALTLAGYRGVVPRSLLGWVRSHRACPVLVTDDEVPTGTIRRQLVGMTSEVAFVVLTPDLTARRCLELMPSTAAVLPVTAGPSQIGVAVDAARVTLSCLPSAAARTLVSALTTPAGDDPVVLRPNEMEWLGALADGRTVAALARSAGYSQREMYRLLSDVYARLGATTRTEALLAADRRGLLRRPGNGTARTASVQEVP